MKKFPDGHFYSPIVNFKDAKNSEARIWPEKPKVLGIDFNDASHKNLLTQVFPKYLKDYKYPDKAVDEFRFFTTNGQFGWLDPQALFCLLRYLKPQRMIEIGSGFSSLLVADVNQRFLANQLNFTCIEPYPRDFLLKGVPGISNVIQQKVQDVPLSTFAELKSGDILFIDSSHVSKTGSDVNHIYFEIIPRLAPGVFIHIHDIFLPSDYPKKWVLGQWRSWNEQYIVQALLMYSKGFEVLFGCNYALHEHSELLKSLLGGKTYSGGSLWLRKII